MSTLLPRRAHEVVEAVIAGNATPDTVASFLQAPVDAVRTALDSAVAAGLLSSDGSVYGVTATGITLVRTGRLDDEWDQRLRAVTEAAQQRLVSEDDRLRATAWIDQGYAEGRLDLAEAERRRSVATTTTDRASLSLVWRDLVPPAAAPPLEAPVPNAGFNTWPVVEAVEAGAQTLGEVSVRLGRSAVSVDSAVRTLVRKGYLLATLPAGAPLEAVRLETTDLVRRAHAQAARRTDAVEMWMAFTRSQRRRGDASEAYEQFAQRWRETHPLPAVALPVAAPEPDDDHLLVSDAERERTTAILGQAYADNRFDLAELERRSAEALVARDREDIDEALEGIPLARPGVPAPRPTTGGLDNVVQAVQVGMKVYTLVFLSFVVLVMVAGLLEMLKQAS